MNALAKLIVTGLGTGYLPVAPGTWGSLAVCLVYLAVAARTGGRQHCLTGTMLLIAALGAIGCVALGRFMVVAFGRKDPRQCTLDEWAGQALALVMLPLGAWPWGWLLPVGAAFVAFRVLDVLKPPPCRQLEHLPFGWGVVADDLMAGAYAAAVVQVLFRLAAPLA